MSNKKPRVLVTVKGGCADVIADDGVEVVTFDFDNYEADPEDDQIIPRHFRDMAEKMAVPKAAYEPEPSPASPARAVKPSAVDEDFGFSRAERHLDHITISPTYIQSIEAIVEMSRMNPGNRVNWIDVNLPLGVVMRDKNGQEIPEECTTTSHRIENGEVRVVIEDQVGNKAIFDLGQAEDLWPDLVSF